MSTLAKMLLACWFCTTENYDSSMLEQIMVHTNRHPYGIQVLSFWLSLVPTAVIIALIIFVQVWRLRRNRRKSRHSVR